MRGQGSKFCGSCADRIWVGELRRQKLFSIIALSNGQIAFTLAMIVVLQVVAAETPSSMYQWTDNQGQIHFGDKPVDSGAQPLVLQPLPTTVISNDRQAAQQRLLQVMTAERQQKKQAKEQLRLQRAERKKHCDKLNEELDELEHGRVVYYREDEAGERQYIDDEARSLMAVKHRNLFEKNCR